MRATAKLLLVTHADCALHETTLGHPERPARLGAAIAGAALPGMERLEVRADEERAQRALRRVHAPGLIERFEKACEHAPAIFDCGDNPISSGSFRSAMAAIHCALAAAQAGGDRRGLRAWLPVRPPGHHALHDRAMGFCFFNNAAVLAEELLANGVGPVAIVDFDVHHGNGTQAHFWERDDVFFLSLHRYPYYPGTGSGDEVGGGPGWGFTRNFPLAAGAGDEIWEAALATGLEEVLRAYVPAAWVVSAGFDAHRQDPLGGMDVSENGYGAFGRLLDEAAGENPVFAVLEGGYHLEALRGSVRAFLAGLTGVTAP